MISPFTRYLQVRKAKIIAFFFPSLFVCGGGREKGVLHESHLSSRQMRVCADPPKLSIRCPQISKEDRTRLNINEE